MSEGPTLLRAETRALVEWARAVLDDHEDRFAAAKVLTRRLGAHVVERSGTTTSAGGDTAGRTADPHAEFGFWTPELAANSIEDVRLELLVPPADLDPGDPPAQTTFERHVVDTVREGEFTWAAVDGVRAGTRDRLGALYQLVHEHDGQRETITDPLAYSLPFGGFAPPELYDVDQLDATRADRDYFRALGTDDEPVQTTKHDGLPRIDPAVSMVEIHPGTATEAGSLGGLARRLESVADRVRDGEAAPADEHFLGYDAVQLMPVEPITENANEPAHWRPRRRDDDELVVELAAPEMINWGYDIVLAGFSTVNAAILETGRPDELVDFIAACHSMPRPLKLVFDVALGHADNRGTELLPDHYFSGPGMYGQDLDYTQPVVRATLLEMQRRKMDFGADGIRVDGAQDFTNWDPERGEWHDDAFLAEMDAVTQEVAGTEYRPWMIYEDGRPWPREDWELASTYRELIEQHPHAFQWSPVTFAHNTPALMTFWATKWWRVREVADMGSQWITGVANHDTVRRGTQRTVPDSWEDGQPVNPYLGEDPRETLDRAYDNPATNALMYCLLPGVPMDFLNANHRTPWGFIRDTDADWNVKVVADEHNFVDWHVAPTHFEDDRFFQRLGDLGFTDRDELAAFAHTLASVGAATDYDHKAMATMLAAMDPPLGDGDPTPADLEAFSYAWMRDVATFANLDHWRDAQDSDRAIFDRRVREFRHERPWLRENFGNNEAFDYRHPTDGTVLYYGHRCGPNEEVLFCANMEGEPIEVVPAEAVGVDAGAWELAVCSPGLDGAAADTPVRLENAAVVVFTRPV
jgi:hypothetical protein